MYRQRQETTWPFLCVLGCLFILCLAAPRAWQRVAQHRSAAEILGQRLAAVDAEALQLAANEPKPYPAPISLTPSPAIQPTAILPATTTAAESPRSVEPEPMVLSDYADAPWETDSEFPGAELAEEEAVTAEAPTASAVPGTAYSSDSSLPTRDLSAPVAALPTTAPAPAAAPQSPTSSDDVRVATRTPSTTTEPRKPVFEPLPPAPLACWNVPASLQTRFEKLASNPRTASWAQETQRLMKGVGPALATDTAGALRLFQQLDDMLRRLEPVAASIPDSNLAVYFRRTGHMLHRRLIVWRYAISAAGPSLTAHAPRHSDPRQLALCLASLDLNKDVRPEARAWEEYLLVDALREACQARDQRETRLHQLAQAALVRLIGTPLTPEQREVVNTPSMVALKTELRQWAADAVDLVNLLESVERYEQSGLPSHGRQVAMAAQMLSLSSDSTERAMAGRLETDWRNSNMRLAISQDLLNRLMPVREPEDEYVRDTILGLPVQGRSLTESSLAVRLLPDPQRLLMAFEVRGQVSASTSSHVGPALFFNDGQAHYAAAKPLEIEAEGIWLGETDVNVINNTRLRGLRTRFDAIPLFGSLAREIARNQHEQQRPAANSEAERKVADRVRERVDSEAYAQISESVAKMRERLFAPLDDLSLQPTMIAGQTTQERLTMRLRLASDGQLGSHTPRPRAPSDSLASLQIHETAINNVLEQLGLNGRTMKLPELAKLVTEKLHLRNPWTVDPNHDDVVIAFAPKDAVCVRCADGVLALTLSIAELSKQPRAWHNFQIRVCYRPEVCGRQVELVREGVVQFVGRLSPGAQIPIRGVFSRIFAPDQTFTITPEWLTSEPRLEGLVVTQFIIDDGWIGTALGPDRGLLPSPRRDSESDITGNDARRKADRTATLRQFMGRDREPRR